MPRTLSSRAAGWLSVAAGTATLFLHLYLQLAYLVANGGFGHGPPTDSALRNWHFLLYPFKSGEALVPGMLLNGLFYGVVVGLIAKRATRRFVAAPPDP